jgi:hypothetical protein
MKRHQLALNGLDYAVTEAGSGEALLMLHGFPDSARLWRHQIPALVDAGFPIVRASTFEVEGVLEGAWFGFAYDAVVRIRPGRTDIRVADRDPRPNGGATCRLMDKIVTALEDEIRYARSNTAPRPGSGSAVAAPSSTSLIRWARTDSDAAGHSR